MPDDDLIDLLKTPRSTESDSGESAPAPDQRDSFTAFFIGVAACFVPIGVVFVTLKDRPGGMQIAAVVAYTLLIPYILSNRFLSTVPWALLNRFRERFLLLHCIALAVIFGITTLAFAAKPRLPGWFVTSGRKPALFYYCLGGILLALAFWECSWISGHKDEQASGVEQS
jgi:hypothetical protein